jgi:hypothetical protein
VVARNTRAVMWLREPHRIQKSWQVSYALAIGTNPDTCKQIAACRLIESKRAQSG